MAFSRHIHSFNRFISIDIDTVLYDLSIDRTEQTDTVRELIISIQNVDLICLLKLYQKIYSRRMEISTRGCKVFKFS